MALSNGSESSANIYEAVKLVRVHGKMITAKYLLTRMQRQACLVTTWCHEMYTIGCIASRSGSVFTRSTIYCFKVSCQYDTYLRYFLMVREG